MFYALKAGKLFPLKDRKALERDVEGLISDNLDQLLGLQVVCRQFSIEGKYIDILAFDQELNAPVIIELKKENDRGLFDQGMEYFNLLLNRKNDFLIKLHEVLKIEANPANVDWSASRVIFIGREFTLRQRRAVDFKGLPIELYDYDWYQDGYFKLEPVNLDKRAVLEIDVAGAGNAVEKIKKAFKEYSIDSHFQPDWNQSRSLFDLIGNRIKSMDSRIIEHAKRNYIGYRVSNLKWNLCYIHVYQSKLRIGLPRVDKDDLRDPEHKVVKIPWLKNEWGKQCAVEVRSEEDIEYVMFLIKQVYEKYYAE
jgi:predicted transport protein